MKPTTLSALALAAAAVAAPAFAQSSVTMYGRMNTTIENEKSDGGSRVWKVNNNASRLGFKGVEDMGGGLKASFNLEHGLGSDNGTASSTFWGREAWVQLAGGFGAVRMGNFTPESYFATADYISMHNHDTGSSSDSLYGFDTYRSRNKVGYFTPTMGGLSGSISLSAGERNGSDKRLIDAAVNYVGGPLHLGFGYSDHADKSQMAVRALVELGALTLGGYIQRDDVGAASRTVYRLAGMYTVGAGEFHLNYGRSGEAKSGANLLVGKGDQWTLGYNYNLSKRTKLYGYYTDLDTNKSDSAKAGQYSSMAVGVRHNF